MAVQKIQTDGNAVLRDSPSITKALIQIVAETSYWCDPELYKAMPIWYPEAARGNIQYNSEWEKPYLTREKAEKKEANQKAKMVMRILSGGEISNWTCCHIWGYDDPKFRKVGSPTRTSEYYTCPANLILLPNALSSLTDSLTDLKECLRYHAAMLYNFKPPAVHLGSSPPAFYPEKWANNQTNILPITKGVVENIIKRRNEILQDLKKFSVENKLFPWESVIECLKFHGIAVKISSDLEIKWPELPSISNADLGLESTSAHKKMAHHIQENSACGRKPPRAAKEPPMRR